MSSLMEYRLLEGKQAHCFWVHSRCSINICREKERREGSMKRREKEKLKRWYIRDKKGGELKRKEGTVSV